MGEWIADLGNSEGLKEQKGTVPRQRQIMSPQAEDVRPEWDAYMAASAIGPAPQVDIVVPVKNEERDLEPGVRRLVAFLRDGFPFRSRITIADNGSSDGTWSVATALCAEFEEVRAVRMELPGRGRALKSCWLGSDAEVVAYTDVDLSIGLNGLLPLVASLLSGHSDVAIGTRLARGARQTRSVRREILSRGYNLLLHATLGVGFSDAQCGFKAIRADKARLLLPLIQDTAWFFDTELLVLAERAGLRVHEVPVDCIDDPNSSVKLASTAMADLRGIARMALSSARGTLKVPTADESSGPRHAAHGLPSQLVRFLGIGVVSTVAYVLIYLMLRDALTAQAANAVSLFVTAVANTAANRRITFGIRGRAYAARDQLQGLIAFGAGLALTSMALVALHALSPRPAHPLEATVLVGASLVATGLRFVLYRWWVFRPRQAPPSTRDGDAGQPEVGMPAGLLTEPQAFDAIEASGPAVVLRRSPRRRRR
ncbi:MAG: glycosyltransferase [Streptosporangiaceae bacterium]